MPNKRDPNKTHINFYIDKRVKEVVQEILSEQGMSLTEYLNVAIYNLSETKENEIIEILKKFDGRTKAGKKRIVEENKKC